jgi:sec-independent protein translocase protein TatA
MSGPEIFVIIIVALLLFGADKLPEIARGIGKGMRDFRKATDDIKREFEESTSEIRKDFNDVTSSINSQVNDISQDIQKDANEVSNNLQKEVNDFKSDIDKDLNEVKDNIEANEAENISPAKDTTSESGDNYNKYNYTD